MECLLAMKKVIGIGIIAAIFLMGCQITPSKRPIAMDEMKQDIRQGIKDNDQILAQELPMAIGEALLPNIDQAHEFDHIKMPKQRFNVAADGVEAKAFFLGLVEGSRHNVILDPKVNGQISVNLKNVTISETLEMVRKVYGFGYEYTDIGIRILPADIQTRTFKLNYLNLQRQGLSEMRVDSTTLETDNNNNDNNNNNGSSSSTSSSSSSDNNQESSRQLNSKLSTKTDTDFWVELKSSVESIIGYGDGRRVSVSPMAGLVIVQAKPAELRKVEQFLINAEQALNRQVILEAKILEVELTDTYRSGINWGLISNRMQAYQIGGQSGNDLFHPDHPFLQVPEVDTNPNPDFVDMMNPRAKIPSFTEPFGGVLSLGFNYKKLAAFVELLGTQGNVQVLSSPRVSVTNNQKALIKVGVDEFFVTNVSSQTTVGTTANVPTTDVEFESFFSGIALDVTPQISEDEFVTLHIHPTITSVAEKEKRLVLNTGIQTFPLAKSTVRESDTIIRAKTGQIVIIGGLMQEDTAELVTGVPVLKDIPFLGQAFRHHRQQAKKSELVILLRPIVMNSSKWNQALEEVYDRYDELDAGFHQGGNKDIWGNLAEKW